MQVRGLVEILVVVDAEYLAAARRGADPADLRLEEARRHVGHDDERRQAVEVRHAAADGIAGNLGVVPLDGKGDRRVAQHAEIVRSVRVLPDVLAVHHEVPSEGLLETGVELVAPAGAQRRGRYARANGRAMSALITGSLHPRLESTRFSLNGVSRVRA